MSRFLVTSALLAAVLGAPLPVQAQHAPLIERMADSPAAPASAPPAGEASPPIATAAPYDNAPPPRAQIGDATRALLRLQADGGSAGKPLPMLGEAASRSYQRYLTSFDHPIPEYFETTVPNSSNGGNSR
ncbi:DUF3613 domain-containing protein [Stenotrophomonas sp. MH1]|uniref:DUF3613 domain-containing protein n=1 Tax=Stenotrophomonas capsici TaxID=3110230 RepID=A0ABU5UZE1_9GAMM|nr:DUF3613 domain-containing protein [Stenotrophomonas sp. MH1]MEA5666454.1 DUF3613 domain-containing protein [Stenotrophomonas sp. MH1]